MAERNGTIIEFPRGRHIGPFACACATWPKNIFIDVRRAADGWMATTLARCSIMKGHYRIRPTIGANKI
jgi:hypothetical protein